MSTAFSRTPQANLPDNSTESAPLVIRAVLCGDDRCSALGITAVAFAPVIGLCAKLVAAGIDPLRPLEAWRGDVLAVKVRTIGEAARLRVAPHGSGFEPLCGSTAAPWARLPRPGALAPISTAPRSVEAGAYLVLRRGYWRERLAGMVRRRAGGAR